MFNSAESEWLYQLQKPWPLTERPLETIATQLHTDEATLVAFIQRLQAEGFVRRIGAIFDSRRLGYKSCLFAIQAPDDEIEAIAATVGQLPGVTHVYTRAWPKDVVIDGVSEKAYTSYPKLWYTLSAPADHFDEECEKLRRFQPVAFPASTRYKIDVVFDTRTRTRDEQTEYKPQAPDPITRLPSEADKCIIRYYQRTDLSLVTPFRSEDLPLLRQWQAEGIMRRFALLIRHRATGFSANGMCCWKVPMEQLNTAGRALAEDADVTHCYARPEQQGFPFNLYAMIHKTSWEEGYQTFQRLTTLAQLPPNGKVFFSLKEFKKSSVPFFYEEK